MLKSLNRCRPIMAFRSISSSTNSNKRSYEDAIIALNSLQTNSLSLSISIQMKQQPKHDEANFNLRDTEKYFERIDNFNLNSLDKLSIIHVSGSKGKGSTCMYTEAILREYKTKTALFTSPHLVSVTERIKISGESISKSLFTKYFWEVYDALQRKKDTPTDMPSYFKFLQIMAFYIFVNESVDVAIIEVGIGGQFDSTNIIKNTEIVGITALQLEHTQLLGNTLKEIAWQKAGIIKKNSCVYVMDQQHRDCNDVINDRFHELQGKRLSFLPSFDDYKWLNCNKPDFSQTADVNRSNYSLAAQISACWLRKRNKLPCDYFSNDILKVIDKKFVDAYQKCQFEGRFQRIEGEGITFFLDGAHTIDSMRICANWFEKQLEKDNGNLNVLVFNVTGDRDSEQILEQLHSIKFNLVCFTTNILDSESYNEQCENFTGVVQNTQLERCFKHKDIWQEKFNDANAVIFPTIQSTIDYINSLRQNNINLRHVNALFTGSLHLVGSCLKIINLSMDEQAKMHVTSN